MALVNVWHHRKVAEASAKSCDICFKPTTSVLITPDNKDHFYVCPGHLKDRGFCSPIVDEEEAAAKKKKEEIDREIKIIQQEYEEKLKKRKKGKEQKDKEKDADKEKAEGDKDEEKEKIEKEKDAKIKAIGDAKSSPVTEDAPRIYALQKIFYQKRLDRLKSAEIAKRNRERLKTPNLFPFVPTGDVA